MNIKHNEYCSTQLHTIRPSRTWLRGHALSRRDQDLPLFGKLHVLRSRKHSKFCKGLYCRPLVACNGTYSPAKVKRGRPYHVDPRFRRNRPGTESVPPAQ